MNLLEYSTLKGGTGTIDCPVFAEIAGSAECSAATLYQIALGHKQPGWKLAVRIEAATESQVSRADLRPDMFADLAA